MNAAGMQSLFALHHCGKISQAELDSLTIGQLGISRGGPAGIGSKASPSAIDGQASTSAIRR
jgi:hypothetical protein